MGNDNQYVDQPVPAFVNPTTTPIPSSATTTTAKDGIVAIQTPLEHIETRQPLLHEQKVSTKTSSPSFISADKLFAIALFILLIILIAYILFHGKVTDVKLNRLTTKDDFKSNDIRSLLEDMNRTLKSIERLLIAQTKKTNINLQLNGQDIKEFYSNQTVLNEVLRRFKENL